MSKSAEHLNAGHTGYEYYVENPRSSAPMMYSVFDTLAEAEEVARPEDTIYVREVEKWKEVE
jgi:hypothetical protein